MLSGFLLDIDGRRGTESEGYVKTLEAGKELPDGSRETTETYESASGDVVVASVTVSYPDSPVVQRRIQVSNRSERDIRLTRIDTVRGLLAKGGYTLDYFECPTNGLEFSPRSVPLAGTKVLEAIAGRSSRGMHPWFTLRDAEGGTLAGAVAWSGNWIFRFEPADEGAYRLTGGLSDWEFAKTLRPGETMESPAVLYAHLPEGGLDAVSIAFGGWGRRYWYPRNEISRTVPAAWNHWWPYEDSAINEDVFRANADEAAELGLEICTLDAGWFGEPDPNCNDHLGWSENVDWFLKRGDWHKINTLRFPSGIAALSEYVRGKGMKFGIWCEIEALGIKSEIGAHRPELPARRDGEHLGYVCLGNPEARDWAFGVLERLITEYKAEWIKLDFNLDPCAGCNRTDHGHGDGDGLFEHYRGYYELLTRVREKYPEVYLENCSSGGLRIDLGLARHTHGAFLSDPDFTRHHLQLFWGASMMLHPSACFHFSWSETIVHYDSNLDKDPIKPDMPRHRLDYIIRANMLNGFGCSYRLPELPGWAKARLMELIGFYRETVRRFVAGADMHRLTGQTIRTGSGDSWNGYLYVLEGAEEALLFAFRLTGGEPERVLRLTGLDASSLYELHFEDSGRKMELSGAALAEEGLTFSGMEEESSEVVRLRKLPMER
ncbi:alpha-galactosidase [Paenibacillus sacheonensis]|uniref:alpha-galactosidase n=1 Tax=Paenibacillus sacheonensis TaxID=742054 RepID=A0A7X4YJX5_9BACL|nr:alpha-galactosidase [Paenibacillus sacheonensis]MBM7564018.1 alpha-galactosidase [Paenibacillus sacheonensis]NBC67647.1 alpha-galactosidase [Paenibacillus sacheonensis]